MKRTTKQWADALLAITEGKEGKDFEDEVKTFAEELTKRHEQSRWREISRFVGTLWKARYGTADIFVETAHELSPKDQEQFQKNFPHTPVTWKVSDDLLGGARIRIDDRQIDNTLQAALRACETTLQNV